MARRAETLYERVCEDSFRADRYGHLLAGPLLPRSGPGWAEPRLWRTLRRLQRDYRDPQWSAARCAADFSKLVRVLHHRGRLPGWLREETEPKQATTFVHDPAVQALQALLRDWNVEGRPG